MSIAIALAKNLTEENLFEKPNEFRNFIITTGGEISIDNIGKFKKSFFYCLEKEMLVNNDSS